MTVEGYVACALLTLTALLLVAGFAAILAVTQ